MSNVAKHGWASTGSKWKDAERAALLQLTSEFLNGSRRFPLTLLTEASRRAAGQGTPEALMERGVADVFDHLGATGIDPAAFKVRAMAGLKVFSNDDVNAAIQKGKVMEAEAFAQVSGQPRCVVA